jgi:cytochrome c biogenesis protein
MAALLISGSGGIDEVLPLPVAGQPVAVGHGTNLRVQADSFENVTNEQGRSLDYISHLKLYDGDELVAEQDIRVNSPLRYQGINFHQNTFGMAAEVKVENGSQAVLYDGSVALTLRSNDGLFILGQFEIDGYEVTVLLPASGMAGQGGIEAGQAAFQLIDPTTETAVNMGVADQGTPLELEGLSFTFAREREYTGIGVRNDPGSIWMWIGSALLLIGMTTTFAFRPRRIWVRALTDPEGNHSIKFGSSDKADSTFAKQFQNIVLDTATRLPKT